MHVNNHVWNDGLRKIRAIIILFKLLKIQLVWIIILNYSICFFFKKCDIYKKHLGLRIYKRSSEVVGMLCNMSKNNKKNKKIKNQAKTKQNKKQKKTCNNLQISWRHIFKIYKMLKVKKCTVLRKQSKKKLNQFELNSCSSSWKHWDRAIFPAV